MGAAAVALRVLPFFQSTPALLRPFLLAAGWAAWWKWIATRSGKGAFRRGWAASTLVYLWMLYWLIGTITRYSDTPWGVSAGVVGLLALYLGAYDAVLALGAVSFPATVKGRIALFGLAWGLLVLKSRLFTGFPWGDPAVVLADWPPLVQSADLIGSMALSAGFVVTLYEFVRPGATRRAAAAGLAMWIALAAYGGIRMRAFDSDSTASRVRVLMVQPSVPQELKMSGETAAGFFRMLALSRLSPPGSVDLVVWPEASVPVPLTPGSRAWGRLQRLQRKNRVPLLLGADRWVRAREGALKVHNSAFLVDEQGRVRDFYDKVHLVPFGEYIPLRSVLFFVDKLAGGMYDIQPGMEYRPLHSAKGDLGVLICFESVFPDAARALQRRGARVLIVITNDAWFGWTSGAFQHLQHTRLRAVETRRSVIFVANSGPSAVVDRAGRIRRRTGLFEITAEPVEVALEPRRTGYGEVGGLLDPAAPVACLLIGGWDWLRRRLEHRDEPAEEG